MAAPDRNLPANCLARELSTRCMVTEQVDIPELDLKPGDGMDYVLYQIAQKALEQQQLPSDLIDANISCLGGAGQSICATKIVVRSLNYSLVDKAPGLVEFVWDLNNIRSSLPEGYTISSIAIEANSSSSPLPLLSSSAIRASITFEYSAYPITVDFSIRVDTDCGQVELTSSISLFNPAVRGDFINLMGLNDFTSQGIQDLTQNDYNELVAREICLLKDQTNNLQGSTDFGGDISSLDQRVTTLEGVDVSQTQLSRTNCGGGIQEEVTLIAYLTDLQSRTCLLEAELKVSDETIILLTERIDTLEAAVR